MSYDELVKEREITKAACEFCEKDAKLKELALEELAEIDKVIKSIKES